MAHVASSGSGGAASPSAAGGAGGAGGGAEDEAGSPTTGDDASVITLSGITIVGKEDNAVVGHASYEWGQMAANEACHASH